MRYYTYHQLCVKNQVIANRILERLETINLNEVLSCLPIPEGVRKSFQDLLSYRSLSKVAIDSEGKREELYQQRKEAERGGWSINSNIDTLLSQFEQEFKYSNLNYIANDCNEYYKTICYNTICGLLNSHATTSNAIGLMGGISPTKIEELDSTCLIAMIFFQNSEELRKIFKRYEIGDIKLSDDALETINNCWKNLSESDSGIFTGKSCFLTYLDNLVFVTTRIKSEGLKPEHIYKAIIKHWANARSFNVHNKLFADLLEHIKPNSNTVEALMNIIMDSIEDLNDISLIIEKLADYMEEYNIRYKLNLDKVSKDSCDSLYPLYDVLNAQLQPKFSELCQEYLSDASCYLWFLNRHSLPVISVERFESLITEKALSKIYVCKTLSQMRSNELYSNVHHLIDSYKLRSECLTFFIDPVGFHDKESVPGIWLLMFNSEEYTGILAIAEYRIIIKQYLIENGDKMSKRNRKALIERL